MKRFILILWPSFVVGAGATAAFFAAIDPDEVNLVGGHPLDHMAAYTVAFFFFWAVAAASSAFTCFLQRGANEINR